MVGSARQQSSLRRLRKLVPRIERGRGLSPSYAISSELALAFPMTQPRNTATIKAAITPIAMVLLLCGATLCAARSAAHSQQLAEPLAISEPAAGVFVHIGAFALMTRDNAGAI